MNYRRLASRLTKAQKTLLGTACVLAFVGVLASITRAWALVGVVVTAFLLLLVALVVMASSMVSRRVKRHSDSLMHEINAYRSAPQGASGRAHAKSRLAIIGAATTTSQWARRLRDDPKRLEAFFNEAKRTRSYGARDVLANAATNGELDYSALSHRIDVARSGQLNAAAMPSPNAHFWLTGLLALARLLFAQRTMAPDLRNALHLYEFVESNWGVGALSSIDRSYYSDLLVTWRQYERAAAVLDYDEPKADRKFWHRFLRLNAVNPNLPGVSATEEAWLAGLNEIYAEHGYAPVHLRPGPEPAFFRLVAEAPPAERAEQPLVTVMMPIYEPDESTDVAIASILGQSWQNLELIIVDDGSPLTDENGEPTDYRTRLQRWAETDERITLILNDANRGAYSVRNQAYALATGHYVTVADKDDWHHPQQIEYQVSYLEEHPEQPAILVNWVRVDESLRFLLRWGPDRVVHSSFASLMFRRAEVQERLGYWDTVRKGADKEYKTRMEVVYGVPQITPIEPVPLALSLMGTDNLTSVDMGLGFEHEDRRSYRRGYNMWHERIAQGASPYLAINPERRPFPAPASFLPARLGTEQFDVVYVADFGSAQLGNAAELRAELADSIARGLRVGIVPVADFMHRRIIDTTSDIDDLLLAGAIERVALSDVASVRLIVVRWPSVMQVTRDAPSALSVGEVVVVADRHPMDLKSGRRNYDVTMVSENVHRIFGTWPTWTTTKPTAGKMLQPQLAPGQMLDGFWAGAGAYSSRETPSEAAPDEQQPVMSEVG
ncbi:glycosyltransferase family 2 protein [Georgenia sp. AZ-5]|uniref:glycosyltransferase family 2 protein n=1 Tax=Georgenia sp. AZ-5 TaxID=3367526 RepID=UPI00375426CB